MRKGAKNLMWVRGEKKTKVFGTKDVALQPLGCCGADIAGVFDYGHKAHF